MKPVLCFVALLLWAGLSAHAFAVSVVVPGGIAAAPVRTYEESAEPEHPAPANASPAVVKSVRFTVRDTDDALISGAKVKVSKGKDGNSSYRMTVNGVATFDRLPAVKQSVDVTASGYKSYAGTADLRNGKTEFQIELEPREERDSSPPD